MTRKKIRQGTLDKAKDKGLTTPHEWVNGADRTPKTDAEQLAIFDERTQSLCNRFDPLYDHGAFAKIRRKIIGEVIALNNGKRLHDSENEAQIFDESIFGGVCERVANELTHDTSQSDLNALLADLIRELYQTQHIASSALFIASKNVRVGKALRDLPQIERSETARKGGEAKSANSPMQKIQDQVKEHWDMWQEDPTRYGGVSAFDKDMMNKFSDPFDKDTPQRLNTICGWRREWEKNK